jgi:serine/threonine protein kinase
MMSQNWIGKTIGDRYQIDTLLGQGGMSAVYRATDPNLRRQVAIKLIHPHLAVDPNFVNRFKEEAAAIARLRHPNIVQVHDFDNDGDTYYMVMEYLVGETLQTRLKRLNAAHRYISYPQAIQICTQMCEAVGYAHSHELIHRDIKPANIMLDLRGQAILMDFGIVKIVGGQYHTATGATVGTAKYMSPEQIRSERADERSDIYSLGVTLYEMLSGRTPYEADSVMTLLMMVVNDPLPDVRQTRQGIPESLAAVVEKALAKEQADRFQTTGEMATALQQAQEEVAGMTSTETVVDDRLSEQATVVDVPTRVPEEISRTEPDSIEIVQGQKSRAEASKPERDREETDLSAAPTLKDLPTQPTPASRQTILSRVKNAARSNTRRIIIAAAVVVLLAIAAGVGISYTRSQVPASSLAPVDRPSEPLDAQTAQFAVSLGRWETNSIIAELAVSPDGDLVGTANNRGSIRLSKYRFYSGLWQVDTGSPQTYHLGHTDRVNSVAFSADGRLFATASDDDTIALWQVSDGGLARKIEASLGGITNVDFSPGNLLLAASSWNGDVGLWQLSDGHLLRTLQGHEDGARDVEFSPDGNLIASASDDHTIRLWQVSDGSLVHTLQGHTAPVRKLAFSPDGNLIASASNDYAIRLWQVSEGSLVHTLQGHNDYVSDIAFSTDGSLLVSGGEDGALVLWQVTSGDMLRVLAEHSDSIMSVAFSPDGHRLVSGAADGVLQFWGLSEAIPVETESADD